MLEIRNPKEQPLTEKDFDRLFEIVTFAYALTEKEMFGDNYIRIPKDELRRFIDQGQVLVAFLNDHLVGGVRHYFVETGIYSFGLLASDFEQAKKGIGKALVTGVKEVALKKGAKKIKIEILRPANFEIESKTMIKNWYLRMGYKFTNSIPLDEVIPELAHRTITPCVFDYYVKTLS